MADEFDRYLSAALAPPDRTPDRKFVARVQARIALEERLAAQQRSLLGNLLKQLGALGVIAAALWWISRSGTAAGLASESPAVALSILLALFMLVVVVLGFRTRPVINPLLSL